MIYYVATERFSTTIQRLLTGLGKNAKGLLSSITYEELYFERAVPIGNYIFTDFDRLSRYEIDGLAAVIAAVRASAPEINILNHPLAALERVPLLACLHQSGINDFEALRIDTGQTPSRFPVFIRAEDGYGGSDMDVLETIEAFTSALDDLRQRGLTTKGRAAIGYVGERDEDGFFRKYGAFNLGGAIVPQHLMFGDEWVVKKRSSLSGDVQVEAELDYVRSNPHREALEHIFGLAGIDFGRIDYGFHQGRLQVYEINTNPNFPKFGKSDARSERRVLIRRQFLEALHAINAPHPKGRVAFRENLPRAHDKRWPKGRLAQSLARRLADRISGRLKRGSI